MRKQRNWLILRAIVILLVMVGGAILLHLFPVGSLFTSQQLQLVHVLTFYVCVGVAFLACAALFYALYRFRHSQGVTTKHFHRRFSTELLWTVIPFIILVLLLIPVCIALWKSYGG
jgi:cytochrome c oxidase subunit 2